MNETVTVELHADDAAWLVRTERASGWSQMQRIVDAVLAASWNPIEPGRLAICEGSYEPGPALVLAVGEHRAFLRFRNGTEGSWGLDDLRDAGPAPEGWPNDEVVR